MARRKKPKIVYVHDHEPEETWLEEVESDVEEPAAEFVVGPEDAVASRSFRPRARALLMAVFLMIVLVVTAAFIWIPADPNRLPQPKKVLLPNCLDFHPEIDWGYELHTLDCQKGLLADGQELADVLLTWRVGYKHVIKLLEKAEAMQIPLMSAGNAYTVMHQKSNPQDPHLFCYEPGPEMYVLMNLKGNPQVHVHHKQILRREKRVTDVVVRTTLAEEMFNRAFGLRMTRDVEEALRYKVDLFHMEPGDHLRLLYEETEYEGGYVDIGKVIGVNYTVMGEEHYAFWFDHGKIHGYFDDAGRAMKEGFLMAPLEFGRISSPYNPNRPDPVSGSGEIIPHLGTDYAAPEGTPILAVADGTVMEAEFRGNNGNYVKLFHSDVVQTQYLHMSAFAEGIAPGVPVKQGQVIGYVGSTGRSTGPHVCFRYWKNGIQTDHRKEKSFGAPMPLDGQALERFQYRRDSLLAAFSPV